MSVLRKDPAVEPVENTLLNEVSVQEQASKQGVRVILSGWGGDESLSMGGRGYFAGLLLGGRWLRLFREISRHGPPLKLIAMEALLLLFRDRQAGMRKIAARSLFAESGQTSYISPRLIKSTLPRRQPFRQTSIRSTMVRFLTDGSLAQRMDSWTASGSDRNLTYAYPLLDRRLVEFAVGLPPDQFVRGEWNRWIMRNSMAGVLPDSVRWEQDKTDPLLIESTLEVVYQTFEQIGKILENADREPSRAVYLDMPRLVKTLRPEVLANRPKQGPILHALQFLDF